MPTPKPCEKCGRDYYPLRRGYCNRCDAHRRAKIGYQSTFVDAEPVRQHIKVLQDAGVGIRRIAVVAGLDRKRIQVILNGRPDRGTPPSRRISTKTAEAILAVPIPDICHRFVAAGAHVPALGTVRRLQSLVAFGYSRSYLASRIGWAPRNFSRLIDPTITAVRADTAQKVEALYNELEATPGPSTRARNDGIKRGWKVPMFWDDDIDSPEAVPDTSEVEAHFLELYDEMRDLGFGHRDIFRRIDVGYHDRDEVVAVLTKEGMSASQIAELVGISERTVVRRRGRTGVAEESRWIREKAG